jgi:hypothetical protein
MSKPYTLAAAGVAALTFSCAALAQFGPPPPGSAHGTESGTYGSSIGYDVRGTGPVDRFGRPYDPMNPTDTERKPIDPRERDKADVDRDRGTLTPGARGPADTRGTMAPGASMNPGLSPGSGPGGQPSMSPNLNPGLGAGSGSSGGPGRGAGASGSQGSSGSR